MTVSGMRIHKDTYLDSLLIMVTTVTMDERPGVSWAGAVMASPRGLEDLAAAGFSGGELDGLSANDLVLAVRADDEETVEAALDAGREAAFSERSTSSGATQEKPPTSIAEAVRRTPGVDVAIVSVPGDYAALEAHHALTAGLHVLLFSDNVPVEEEVELKERAARLGLLVMGPGAGTAVLGGTGLGFANGLQADGERAVGVVAAAGTGAQEVSALLDRWGVRVSQVIGVGGRDLTEAVGGRMAQLAARALDADPGTGAVLLVSKPPSAGAAEAVLAECRDTAAVAVFLGLDGLEPPEGVRLSPTLEQGALAAAALAGATPPPLAGGLRERVAAAAGRLDAGRTSVRGLFSGGTLCYEAQYVLEGLLGPVYSNEPLRKDHGLPAPDGAHVLLRPRRGGVHPGPAAPDDRPGSPAGDAARRRGGPDDRGSSCSTSSSATAATPTRPASSLHSAPSSWPAAARRSWPTCWAPRRTRRGTRGSGPSWRRPAASCRRPTRARRTRRPRWSAASPHSPRRVCESPAGGAADVLHQATGRRGAHARISQRRCTISACRCAWSPSGIRPPASSGPCGSR